MSIHRSWSIALAIALAVLVPATAQAAPPDLGARAPVRIPPMAIDAGYVGPALVGPRSYCGPVGTGSVQAATVCIDTMQRSCRAWRRGPGGWVAAQAVRNDSPTVFWVAPYARGWHWAWSFTTGFRALPTSCLAAYGPLMT